jgi:cytochrome c oxidase cbb3-type subunit 1
MNGLMTLNGAWDKIRTDPIIRFLVASLAFYGMATFEGPMMSIRAVNSLSHYTDWTVGHVHSGALGWNGMIIFAMVYFLTPRLWNRGSMYSNAAMNWHFWLAMIGIVLYAASMWVSGIMEGLMWREVDDQGFLVNSFADTVSAKFPMYVVRGLGGVLYLGGAALMCWNMWMTIRGYEPVTQKVATMTPPAGATAAPAATPAE